ncbi:MAG TPA: hypothetical protein VFO59_10560 [Dehalococcoidia bacterium]|nr:hypothetical protein [Dehalococcoidia bacterium]
MPMIDQNSSIAARWKESVTAQGIALGCTLGPVGALLAYLFSSLDRRPQRTFAALLGSLAASIAMLIVGGLVALAITLF